MGHRTLVLVCLVGCATAGRDSANPDGNAAVKDSNHGSDGATGCTTMMSDLLMNGSFDSTPVGSMWSATPANPMYPIITANGVTPQSAPDKAWMGSVVSATDDMYEAVSIPASTTMLVVAGYSQVKTAETGTTANDTAKVELTDATGTTIEAVLALDNTQAGTTWVPFSHTFTASVAGKMVRLHFTTTNNSTKATSFYFDTVSLQASFCQ